MEIRIDDLSGPKIAALLEVHLRNCAAVTPAGSMHALNIDALRGPDITFWSAWEGADLLGCGALKELDAQHGEIKSMRTAAEHLRKGVASALLQRIIDESRRRGYKRLSLETGSFAAFEAARRLYLKSGFTYCGPFGAYVEDPNSVFMTREM